MSDTPQKIKTSPSNSPSYDVDRTPVAKDIWCYSAREKAFTWHVVVNHDAQGYVDRVQCKVTGSIHKYKRQNKPTTATASSRKMIIKKTTKPTVDLEEVWYKGVKDWGNKVVRTYSPAVSFQKGDVIEHTTFGKGVVQARRDNKIDVLFKSESKTLLSSK